VHFTDASAKVLVSTPSKLANTHHNANFEGVDTKTLALASVKCTQAAHATYKGQKISCIKGVPIESNKPIALFPGEVPIKTPLPEK